ncbi:MULTISPECIES: hypothetical protein [Oxalobacteraceae]|uniref:hypothetical protein n=1 Tax=Oxalobacteraceae TaxID=75682 RepID=UPI001456270C|nr:MULTISPECIES: hypothetical protein [Oxalobacteraceae]
MKGITIIQLMILLFIAGIVGALVVRLLIDKRCEAGGPEKLCMDRNAIRTK